ncbi:hypothetical protein HanPSC8_Chr06g0240281 [Helianthus annuus]|nr:hypothetical protein HanPSC8_Chr06g0240281 [Helianthus annuus]
MVYLLLNCYGPDSPVQFGLQTIKPIPLNTIVNLNLFVYSPISPLEAAVEIIIRATRILKMFYFR